MPTPKFRSVFGAYVREIREAMGLTQAEFSRRVDIPQGYLSELEQGDKAPSGDMIDRILDALDLDVSALCRGMLHTKVSAGAARGSRRRGRPPRK